MWLLGLEPTGPGGLEAGAAGPHCQDGACGSRGQAWLKDGTQGSVCAPDLPRCPPGWAHGPPAWLCSLSGAHGPADRPRGMSHSPGPPSRLSPPPELADSSQPPGCGAPIPAWQTPGEGAWGLEPPPGSGEAQAGQSLWAALSGLGHGEASCRSCPGGSPCRGLSTLKPGLPPLRPCHPTREMQWDPRPSSPCPRRLLGRATWTLWATEGPAGARRPRSRCLTHSPPMPGTPLESVCLALAREPGDLPEPAGSPWAHEPGKATPMSERHTKSLCEGPRPPPPPRWQAQPAPGPARGSRGPVLDEQRRGGRGALHGPHPPGLGRSPRPGVLGVYPKCGGAPSGSWEGHRPLSGP